MKQLKIDVNRRSAETKRITSNRFVGRRKNLMLEIQISGVKNETIICTVPAIEIGEHIIIRTKSPRRDTLHKHIIRTKAFRKGILHKCKDKIDTTKWEIVGIGSSFKTPNSLINARVVVTNGKENVKGTIIKASIVGGGATSPATKDGLPPVDE